MKRLRSSGVEHWPNKPGVMSSSLTGALGLCIPYKDSQTCISGFSSERNLRGTGAGPPHAPEGAPSRKKASLAE